jgi:hypothetical protein
MASRKTPAIGIGPLCSELRITRRTILALTSIVYHMYAVSAWIGGEPSIVGDEHSKIEWFSVDGASLLQDLALPEYVTILHKLL